MASGTLLAAMGKSAERQTGHGAGQGHGECGGEKRNGDPCTRPKGWGTGHPGVGSCKNHGGCTPTHELSGALELARRDVTAMGLPLDLDPHEAILQCIRISAGEVRYASDRIAELQPDLYVGAVESRKERPLSLGKEGEDPHVPVQEVTSGPPALHIWVETRHRAMDRLVNYSKIALAAGVEERRVRVAERAGEMMAQLIRGVLTDLGVDLQAEETREVVTRHLTLLEGGRAA